MTFERIWIILFPLGTALAKMTWKTYFLFTRMSALQLHLHCHPITLLSSQKQLPERFLYSRKCSLSMSRPSICKIKTKNPRVQHIWRLGCCECSAKNSEISWGAWGWATIQFCSPSLTVLLNSCVQYSLFIEALKPKRKKNVFLPSFHPNR